MTDGAIQRHGQTAYPNWLPDDVHHYLMHIEQGTTIRALARAAGCHASTVHRHIRRNETRRDDPLLDVALERLAVAARLNCNPPTKDQTEMMAQSPTPGSGLPDEAKLESEARRIMRRLGEPEACLAIAPGMEKAVVVRETPEGRTVRTAVLDRQVAEAFVVKDWIELRSQGKVARYGLGSSGRAALKRLLAEREAARQGFSEAPSVFGDQHRKWAEREVRLDQSPNSKRIRYNAMESPLAAIARRKGRNGKPFLNAELVEAGERLREDFELAQMGPRVAQNWDRFLTAGDRGGFSTAANVNGPEGARDRVARALADLGPGLGDVALRCCCFLEGMELAEKRMGWSARSGKIVLKIALQRLRRHYRMSGRQSDLIG